MSKLVETLRLKEIAEEDIYFARRDQELIQALHNQRLAEAVAAATRKNRNSEAKNGKSKKDTAIPQDLEKVLA